MTSHPAGSRIFQDGSAEQFDECRRPTRIWPCDRRVRRFVLWHVVKDSAKRIGLEKLAPHDLHRTFARLCLSAGGELEQIQFLLGHVSIQTTERYLGCKQRIRSAVNPR